MLCLHLPAAWGAEVNGALRVREEYDDNIFLRANNETADYKTILSPELSFSGARGSNTINLLYSSEMKYHYKYRKQDTFSHSLAFSHHWHVGVV